MKNTTSYWKLPYPMVKCTKQEVEALKFLLLRPEAFARMEQDPWLCNLLYTSPIPSDKLKDKIAESCEWKTFLGYLLGTRYWDIANKCRGDATLSAYLRWIWIIKLINFNRARYEKFRKQHTPNPGPFSNPRSRKRK